MVIIIKQENAQIGQTQRQPTNIYFSRLNTTVLFYLRFVVPDIHVTIVQAGEDPRLGRVEVDALHAVGAGEKFALLEIESKKLFVSLLSASSVIEDAAGKTVHGSAP